MAWLFFPREMAWIFLVNGDFISSRNIIDFDINSVYLEKGNSEWKVSNYCQ